MTQSRPQQTPKASDSPEVEPASAEPAPPIVIPMDYAVIHVPETDRLAAVQAQTLAAEAPGTQAAGGNKPLPPKWFPPNSAYVSRMPNGYIVENAALRNGV